MKGNNQADAENSLANCLITNMESWIILVLYLPPESETPYLGLPRQSPASDTTVNNNNQEQKHKEIASRVHLETIY